MGQPDEDRLDGHIVMESLIGCVEGHYYHNFITGNTEEQIGEYVFYSSYHQWKPENIDELELHQALCNFYLEIAQREWHGVETVRRQ